MIQNPALRNQSRGRGMTEAEDTLAEALERIFETGCHDFAQVADRLNDRGTPRPSGDSGPWTRDVLAAELKAINDSHDAAYAEAGIGA